MEEKKKEIKSLMIKVSAAKISQDGRNVQLNKRIGLERWRRRLKNCCHSTLFKQIPISSEDTASRGGQH